MCYVHTKEYSAVRMREVLIYATNLEKVMLSKLDTKRELLYHSTIEILE